MNITYTEMQKDDMNCLSDVVFENLLFVNVSVCSEPGIALFDTGAQKTVVSKKILGRCKGDMLTETVKAGNNNGQTLSLNTAKLRSIKIADKELTDFEVLVIDDDFFVMEDSQGNPFSADMLLGYDIIGKYKWTYLPNSNVLTVSCSGMTTGKQNITYNGYLTINVVSDERSYVAGIDTGHTETILRSTVKIAISDLVYIEDEVVGVGSTKKICVPMLPKFNLEFEETEVELHNVTIQKEIHGAPPEMDLLLGMDFLEGKAWELDFVAGALRFIG